MSPLLRPLQGSNFERTRQSQSANLPSPVLGWVSASTPEAQNPGSARILTNLIPGRTYAQSRNGYIVVDTLPAAARTLITYNGHTSANRKLFAASGEFIYEITGATPFAPFSDDVSIPPIQPTPLATHTEVANGFSNDLWRFINTANAADDIFLVMVNGQDGIWTYDPVGGFVKVDTGSVVSDGFIEVVNHKQRLWFIDSNSSVAYYGSPFTPGPTTLTAFPVGPLLKAGGNLAAIASLSRDSGSGPDDFLVMISTNGEMLIFSGVDPADDFKLVGIFTVTPSIGRASLQKFGPELIHLGALGPATLTNIMQGQGIADLAANPIRDEFLKYTNRNKGDGSWQWITYGAKSWAIANVPITPPTRIDQFVMNIENLKWFRITGWNALHFATFNGYLLFSDNAGNICLADYERSDNGTEIIVDWMASWSDFGTAGIKKFNLGNITLESLVKPNPQISIMVDYEERPPTGTPEFPAPPEVSYWDVSYWDVAPWSGTPEFVIKNFGLQNIGFVGAFRYRESIKDSVTRIYGYRIVFQEGGLL